MLKVMCLKVTNEIGSFQFKLVPSAWCEISLVISIHMIFLHLAYVDNQPEIDCKYNIARLLRGVHGLRTLYIANSSPRSLFDGCGCEPIANVI